MTKTNIKWELTELKFKLIEGSAPIFWKITNVMKLLGRKFQLGRSILFIVLKT